ncbi:hypothetical protein XA68_13742 [Ophiocordyceps unilateralis]|uniref:DNA-(apurinic or apyrimidinic site) endonuclease 2 n=1 Tax=Ophiocordyceps unilateralis TaxID=268505 RepID=A0A2A9PAQ7_OPHUN|nr:hypothetical protein XA68_13742 [Ophiocordyceps unilateralis]
MGLRITTWNVNGIRNPFSYQPWRETKTFQAMFDILEADIVVMQETKIQRKDLQDDMVLVPGWDVYFSLPRHKKGYSGVAIYTRNATCAPIRAEEGITGVLCPPKSGTKYRHLPEGQQVGGYPRPGQLSGNVEELELDSEGRCVVLEFPAFVLLGVYSPASRNDSRNDFRLGFLEALDVRVRNLVAAGKQVVLTGDLNVIRSEKDTTNLMETLRKEDMMLQDWLSMPSRRLFNQLLFEGTVFGPRDQGRESPVLWDLCRCFHPARDGMNTCWETKRNTRPANNGSRIDYVLCSDGLRSWFADSNIQEGLMGSDHCPVFATMADRVHVGQEELFVADLMNPPGMFQDGKRVREWSQKDVLPLSAKLIPEFDRRQSIREMFSKVPASSASSQPKLQYDSASRIGEERSELCSSAASTGAMATTSPELDIEAKTAAAAAGGCSDDELLARVRQQPSQLKRALGAAEAAGRASKRTKPASDSSGSKAKAGPGQKTLKGFFKPVASGTEALQKKNNEKKNNEKRRENSSGPCKPAVEQGTQKAGEAVTPLSEAAEATDASERVFDPIQAKESWSKLLGKRQVPRCEHNEPCISLVTKKAGVNCGRSFFICPRPLGPSGEKERDSEWRCGTFIWSSDWGGSSS